MASFEDLTPEFVSLDKSRHEGGARFINELEKLGLVPDAACWFRDETMEEFRLAIVTAVVGEVGVRPLYKLFVRAHARAILPPEIDPLMIELFDPRTYFATQLRHVMPTMENGFAFKLIGMNAEGQEVEMPAIPGKSFGQTQIGDYLVSTEWIYRANWDRPRRLNPAAEFKKFEATIRKQAA